MSIRPKLSDRGLVSNIPLDIFTDRSLSPLEAVCAYLKKEKSLSDAEIASILKRDSSTIWTTISRAIKKKEDTHVRL